MIKFFRKIRQNLLMENKTSKYFKYAIGEIFLVMIGILLALQVNDYYNFKQDRKLEHSLLLELQQTITNDSVQINTDYVDFSVIEQNAFYLDSMIKNKRPYQIKMDSAFGVISTFTISESNYVPWDKIKTLKNGIIQNDSLFNSLSNYYNFSKFLSKVDNYFEIAAYFRKSVYPKYAKSYHYGRIAAIADYEQMLNSNEIKVAIDYCINDAVYYKRRTKHRIKHTSELLEDIRKELKRFQK